MNRLIRCSVPNCDNFKYFKEKDINHRGVILFSFPKDRKNQWAVAIGRSDFIIKNTCYSGRRVCSDHFQESDFEPNVPGREYKKRLRRDAVPSVFLPSQSKDGEITWKRKRRKVVVSDPTSLITESSNFKDSLNETPSPLSPSPQSQEKNLSLQTARIGNCLICSETTCVDASSSSPGIRCKFNGSSDLHLLNEQLWSTFILRSILGLPKWKFEDILKIVGENNQPSEWFLVCDLCSRSLVQCVEMEEKVRTLQIQIKKLRSKLQEEFRRSLETEKRVLAQRNNLDVRETIRNFFTSASLVPNTEVKEESEYEYYDEDNNDFPSDQISDVGDLSTSPSHHCGVVSQENKNEETSDVEADTLSLLEVAKSPEQIDEKDSTSIISATETFNNIALSFHPTWQPQTTLQCSKPNPCVRKDILAKVKKAQASIKANATKHYDCSRCGLPLLTFGALSKHYRVEHRMKLNKRWKDAKASSSQVDFLSDLPTKSTNKRKKQTHKLVSKKQLKPQSKKKKLRLNKKYSQKSFPCSELECKMSFNSENGLNAHIRRKHTGNENNNREICEICGFKEAKSLTMKQHIFHHKIFDNSIDPSVSTTEFICNICKQLFTTRRQLTFHKVNTHSEELKLEVYKCSYCSRNFAKKDSCTYHEMRIHQKSGIYPCDKCDYEAMSKSFLKVHKAKHSKTTAICEFCSATYYSEVALRKHIQRYHPDKFVPAKRKLFVGVAVEKLSTEGDEPSWNFVLRQKQKKQQPILCKYCEAVLPHKMAFNLHLKESHKDKYKYTCNLCGKVYLSSASLQLHKKINHHEKGKSVKCAWCLKRVSNRVYLYAHVKSCPKKPKNEENLPKIMAIEDNSEDIQDNVSVEGSSEIVA